MSTLVRAAEALERGEAEPALRALLTAWNEGSDPALIPAIAVAGEAALPAAHPLLRRQEPSLHAAWLAAARTKDSAAVPYLLEAIGLKQNDRFAAERLEQLMGFPRDPRIGKFAIAQLPLAGGRESPILARLAGRSRHPGARLAIAQHDRTGIPMGDLKAAPEPSYDAALLGRVSAAAEALEDQLRKKRAPLAAAFAAVYAQPDADAPRHVLADALIQLGDPRGELIAFQLEGKGRAEIVEAGLQGAFAGHVAPMEKVEIARGLPHRATVTGPVPHRLPAFRTLKALTIEHPASGFLAWPELGNVREVSGQVHLLAEALKAGPPLPWEKLTVRSADPPLTDAIRAQRLPRLAHLAAGHVGPDAMRRLIDVLPDARVALDLGFDDGPNAAAGLEAAAHRGWTLTFTCRSCSVAGRFAAGNLSLDVQPTPQMGGQLAIIHLLTGPERARFGAIHLARAGRVDPRWERVI